MANGLDGWEMLEMVENSCKLPKISGNGPNCLIWKEMDENSWKWLEWPEMAEYSWTWLGIAGNSRNDWKWLGMVEN